MIAKLNPCPFCGATEDDGIVGVQVSFKGDHRYAFVECYACGVKTRKVMIPE